MRCSDDVVVKALANVARALFPGSASSVGRVCWFSTLHREVFSGFSGFPSPLEKPAFHLICVNC